MKSGLESVVGCCNSSGRTSETPFCWERATASSYDRRAEKPFKALVYSFTLSAVPAPASSRASSWSFLRPFAFVLVEIGEQRVGFHHDDVATASTLLNGRRICRVGHLRASRGGRRQDPDRECKHREQGHQSSRHVVVLPCHHCGRADAS